MRYLEGLRRQWLELEVKGISAPETLPKASFLEPLSSEVLARNNELFQLWDGYRSPDKWKYPPQEDLAALLEEAGFNIHVLSKQRVRATTESETLQFRDHYGVPENVRIKGDVFPYDGIGNSWLHVMDWAIAHDATSLVYHISRQPKSIIDYKTSDNKPERSYIFTQANPSLGTRNEITKSITLLHGRQKYIPAVLPEDRDGLAAVYLIPDTGGEKGDTFWHQGVRKTIARPSSRDYTTYSFYSTFELCSGALLIDGQATEPDSISDTLSYRDYLHVYLLQQS